MFKKLLNFDLPHSKKPLNVRTNNRSTFISYNNNQKMVIKNFYTHSLSLDQQYYFISLAKVFICKLYCIIHSVIWIWINSVVALNSMI